MPRIYTVITLSNRGKFVAAEDFLCCHDGDARRTAERNVSGPMIEVWCVDRFVCAIDAR